MTADQRVEGVNDGEKRVVIVGDHPHAGKVGTLTGQVLRGLGMAEVKLDGGEGGCFAEATNLRGIP